jgi:hypothetical protein
MKAQFNDANTVWKLVTENISGNNGFTSISGIQYTARLVNNSILYKGGNRKNGEEEELCKTDFIAAFNAVKNVDDINTNTIKKVIPTAVYRKRTPFIGLLISSGIIS